jgi:hypothetical protein
MEFESTSVFLDERTLQIADAIMRSPQFLPIGSLLPSEQRYRAGYVLLKHMPTLAVTTRVMPPEWLGEKARAALTLAVFQELMTVVVECCAGQDVALLQSDLHRLIATDPLGVSVGGGECQQFFDRATNRDEELALQSLDVVRFHHLEQGLLDGITKFGVNTLVFAQANGRDGVIECESVSVYNLVQVQKRHGCRSVVDDRTAFVMRCAENLGDGPFSAGRLVEIKDPHKGINIPNLPPPDAAHPRLALSPLIFEGISSSRENPAMGALLCQGQFISFDFPVGGRFQGGGGSIRTDMCTSIGRGESVPIKGYFTREPFSWSFVTVDTVLVDIFEWLWHTLRFGRRLDVVVAIKHIRARLLTFCAKALRQHQNRAQEALGLL